MWGMMSETTENLARLLGIPMSQPEIIPDCEICHHPMGIASGGDLWICKNLNCPGWRATSMCFTLPRVYPGSTEQS